MSSASKISEARSARYGMDRHFMREQGRAGLLDGYGKRKGKSKIAEHEPLRNVVLELLRDYPHITPKKIKAYLEADHPDLDIVSVKSIERFLNTWKEENAQLWTYLVNPDAWKNQYMVAFGSQHEHIERLHQLWEMDSTPADWMLRDGRHSVVGVIDMYSRQLRFHVSKTSRAQAVGLAFRKASEAWGNVIPEEGSSSVVGTAGTANDTKERSPRPFPGGYPHA